MTAPTTQATTQDSTPKGLVAYVYRNGPDSSNGGISGRVDKVTVVGTRQETYPIDTEGFTPLTRGSQVFEATPERPAVVLVYRQLGGERLVHAEPVADVPEGRTPYMAGGAFISSTDSRFGELVGFYGAVALHDRTDTWEHYRVLSN